MYVCIVCVTCCVAYIVVCMYSAVSLYGMFVVWTLYVQCGVWSDICDVVGFYHVCRAFLKSPYSKIS